jgi:zinc transport system substrate-binding protein
MIRFLTALFLLFQFSLHAANQVLVSIKPIHSLVAAVAEGVFEPQLLLDGSISPHTYSLTPKDVVTLQEANLFIWVGESYEGHLKHVVDKKSKKSIKIMDMVGLNRRPVRGGCCHNHGHEEHDTIYDGHVWLAPDNAKVIVANLVQILSEQFPEHAAIFERNGHALVDRLITLEKTISEKLQHVRGKGYLVYHDALQYFDQAFGLTFLGAVVVDADLPPSAKTILDLKNNFHDGGLKPTCLLLEPQYPKEACQKLAATLGLPYEIVDYLGINVPPGPKAYETILVNLSDALVRGLS